MFNTRSFLIGWKRKGWHKSASPVLRQNKNTAMKSNKLLSGQLSIASSLSRSFKTIWGKIRRRNVIISITTISMKGFYEYCRYKSMCLNNKDGVYHLLVSDIRHQYFHFMLYSQHIYSDVSVGRKSLLVIKPYDTGL